MKRLAAIFLTKSMVVSSAAPGAIPAARDAASMASPESSPESVIHDATLIPRIDLRLPLPEIVASIKKAAANDGPGFFYLMNHDVPQNIFAEAIAASHEFYTDGSAMGESKTAARNTKMASSSLEHFGRWGIKGYNAPGVEGAYAKDSVTDVRPEEEVATEQLNTREAYVTRFPELVGAGAGENVPPYVQNYEQFLAEMHTNCSANNVKLRSFFGDKYSAAEIGQGAKLFFAPNPWPESPAAPDSCPLGKNGSMGGKNFRPAITRYASAMRLVAERMFAAFEACLGTELPRDRGMTTYNMARYGVEPVDSGSLGISDHTDWELFTLLYPSYFCRGVGLCDANGRKLEGLDSGVGVASGAGTGTAENGAENVVFTGLEAWYQDRWIAVPHIPGAIILNQGEMLSRLSTRVGQHGARDRLFYKAPVHRVRANTNERERYSLVSFWGPNYEFLLPDRDPEYADRNDMCVLAGEYYLARNAIL